MPVLHPELVNRIKAIAWAPWAFGVVVLLLGACPIARADDPLEVAIPAAPRLKPLTAEEQKRVDRAIENGVTYLRGRQSADGLWRDVPNLTRTNPVGLTALPALALLETGVPPNDPAIQSAARFVRNAAPTLTNTYDIALVVLFLDRLGEAKDMPLLRSLCLRLAAAQTRRGGWSYTCPLLSRTQEKSLLKHLREREANAFNIISSRDVLSASAKRPPLLPGPKRYHEQGQGDNSNTQFAILALWAARRFDVPLSWSVALVEHRFRSTQVVIGWGYYCYDRPSNGISGSMTGVGLLALALGHGWDPTVAKNGTADDKKQDMGIQLGLMTLGALLDHRPVWKEAASRTPLVDYYFLWTVERVAVLCGVDTIGGRDWYRWGLGFILPTQRPDGSWFGAFSCGNSPVVSTAMALLFLKRSDLMPDLRQTLAKRVTIADPGPLPKGVGKKLGFIKTPFLPKGIDTSPGEKAQPERPLEATLGDVKAGQATKLALRVRGPAPFRIIGVRGGDDRLSVTHDALRKDVHDLTLTLRPARAGAFTRTLVLRTDLPGRPEVAVIVRARAAP